jgi:hypothetical protein
MDQAAVKSFLLQILADLKQPVFQQAVRKLRRSIVAQAVENLKHSEMPQPLLDVHFWQQVMDVNLICFLRHV